MDFSIGSWIVEDNKYCNQQNVYCDNLHKFTQLLCILSQIQSAEVKS